MLEVFDIVLPLPQGFVLSPQHLLGDPGGLCWPLLDRCGQLCSLLIDVVLLELGAIVLPDLLSLADHVEDPAHGLLELLDPPDLPGLPDVGGVVLHGQFVGEHQVLLPDADEPELVQVLVGLEPQLAGFPGAALLRAVVP